MTTAEFSKLPVLLSHVKHSYPEKPVGGSTSQSEPCMEQLIGLGLRKEYNRAVCCHPVFNPYAEHSMRSARLDELQAGIKIGRRNTNNLRYVDDTTLMAESKEELKSLLM